MHSMKAAILLCDNTVYEPVLHGSPRDVPCPLLSVLLLLAGDSVPLFAGDSRKHHGGRNRLAYAGGPTAA